MGRGLSGSSEGGGMRHRFHSICPYFAMFPETFVEMSFSTRSAGVERQCFRRSCRIETRPAAT